MRGNRPGSERGEKEYKREKHRVLKKKKKKRETEQAKPATARTVVHRRSSHSVQILHIMVKKKKADKAGGILLKAGLA